MINLALIGGQRCGTTSIWRYFLDHPTVQTHHTFECNFFVNHEEWSLPWSTIQERYFEPGDDLPLFLKSIGILYSPRALERLLTLSPETRLLVVLREPVARAVSAHAFAWQRGWEGRSLNDALRESLRNDGASLPNPELDYIGRGRYADHLETVLSEVDREVVMLVDYAELVASPALTMQRISKFAALDLHTANLRQENASVRPRSPLLARAINTEWPGRSIAKSVIPASARLRLRMKLNHFNRSRIVADDTLEPKLEEDLRSAFASSNVRLAQSLGFEPAAAWIAE